MIEKAVLTPVEHAEAVELHQALDMLYARYLATHPGKHNMDTTTIGEIIRWSHLQTRKPVVEAARIRSD